MLEKVCQLTGKPFVISDLEVSLCEEFGAPTPVICREERFRRLASFRNEKQLFLRSCDATGGRMFSVFSPDAPFPVYSSAYWAGADWDPLSYGQVFDFKRLFMEQLLVLWRQVPRPGSIGGGFHDTRIVQRSNSLEKCFLVFDSERLSHCFACVSSRESSDCADCQQILDCHSCYEVCLSTSSERLRFSDYCRNCKDAWFLLNCDDCNHCLFCFNIQGKTHHIFNQPVSPEEYERVLSDLQLSARPLLELARSRFSEFLAGQEVPHIFSRRSPGCSGNYLSDCSECEAVFEARSVKRAVNAHDVWNSENVFDSVSIWNSSDIAQSVSIRGGKRVLNCVECWDQVSDLSYCGYCQRSSNLIGCVGLQDKEYCIFNKQLSESEYETLRGQITGHLRRRSIWGTALALNLSDFTYNHSEANEFMPLTKIPAKMMGFAWDESDMAIRPSDLLGESEAPPAELFAEVPEILDADHAAELGKKVFICSVTGKPFQISNEEIALYLDLGVPPPTTCFQQRYLERIARCTPRTLYERTCTKSGEPLMTAFPAKWKQRIVRFDEA